MPKLIFTDKSLAGRVYELVLEKTTVGRGEQNTLVISDGSMSAVHCEILMYGPEIIVRDLGSRNGTFVNGFKLVNQQAQLKSGQTVRFGMVEARLELERPAEDDTSTEMTDIYSLDRFERDQKWEKEHPKPADPTMRVDAPGAIQPDEDTVTSFIAAPPRERATPLPLTPAENPSRSKPGRAALVISAILVLGLIILLWALWS